MDEYNIEIKSWDQGIQKLLHDSNPELYEALEYGMNKTDQFMLASYPFAEHVLKDGHFQLPLKNGTTVTYSSIKTPSIIRNFIDEHLLYPVPFGVVTKGYFEAYWEAFDRIIPKGGLGTGGITGARILIAEPKNFNFKNAWNMISGSRTLALLPSMKDTEKFRRLKKNHDIRSVIPRGFNDHFHILKELCKSPEVNWQSQFLFFSGKLINRIMSNRKFQSFREHMYRWGMNATCFDRNRTSFEFIWDEFIRFLEVKGIKEKEYIYNFSKYLILVALGEELAFAPTTSNHVAPIDFFQKIFIKDYKIKYFPSFINAAILGDGEAARSVYYSLQYPIHLNPFPTKHAAASGLDDIRSVKEMHERFFEYIYSNQGICARESVVADVPEKIKFEYFHTAQDGLKVLATSKDVAGEDQRFMQGNTSVKKPFCRTSMFFNGCVKIDKL